MNAPACFDHERTWDRTTVDEPVECGLRATQGRARSLCVTSTVGYRGLQFPTIFWNGQRATSGQNVEVIGPTEQRWATSTSTDGRCSSRTGRVAHTVKFEIGFFPSCQKLFIYFTKPDLSELVRSRSQSPAVSEDRRHERPRRLRS